MSDLDYVLGVLLHEMGVEKYGYNMAMNMACIIRCMLPECDRCDKMEDAIIKKHIKCLKHVSGKNKEMTPNTISLAAELGHLECLKYVHRVGMLYKCYWNSETCERAALNGHLECLKYACENGCPGYKKYLCKLQKIE